MLGASRLPAAQKRARLREISQEHGKTAFPRAAPLPDRANISHVQGSRQRQRQPFQRSAG
jgi:hypothetical protein